METEGTEDPLEEEPLANSFQVPGDVQRRFEADEFKTEVGKLQKDLRDGIGEIGTPTFYDLAGLFKDFAVGLALLAARVNPPSSFRHPHRHVAFVEVWLPMWVKDESLKTWAASAPPGWSRLLSDLKNRRTFRVKLDDSIRKSLREAIAGARENANTKLKATVAQEVGATTPSGRHGYQFEVRRWMSSRNLQTVEQAAKQLGVGKDTLKSIMSSKGKMRCSRATLVKVLKDIGHEDEIVSTH